MKSKSLLKLWLCAIMLCSSIGASAYDAKINGIYYNLNANTQTATVTYLGEKESDNKSAYVGSIVIPKTLSYNGTIYTVKEIGEDAFRYCEKLTSITIPNSVVLIDVCAFMYCSNLKSVSIPDGVASIGAGTFGYSGIVSVVIPNSVTSVGEYAFHECIGLTSVSIPESVISIGNRAFVHCSRLGSVTISNGVKTIGEEAFSGCNRLTSITIPESVTEVGDNAFSNCEGLESIIVAKNNIVYDSRNNCNAIIETSTNRLIRGCNKTIIPNSVTSISSWAFSDCTGLTSIEIPNSVTNIGKSAFQSCYSLVSVTIPNSVTTIGNKVFDWCSALTSVTIRSRVPLTIDKETFDNRKNATLTVPRGCKKVYENAEYWKEFKEIIEEDPIIAFKDPAFKAVCVRNWDKDGDGELSMNEAEAVKDLGVFFTNNADIKTLTDLQYFRGLTGLGVSTFENCTGLTEICIPEGVESIGMLAFASCTSITKVNIPEHVKRVGDKAFYGCSNLAEVEQKGTMFGKNVFKKCPKLKNDPSKTASSGGGFRNFMQSLDLQPAGGYR